MKNFRNIFLVLLFSLSFCLVTNAQQDRVGGNSVSGSPINVIPTNEQNNFTAPTFSLPEMSSSNTETGTAANDVLPIDSNLVILLVAGILFAFYKFQVRKKSKANSIS